MERIGCYSFKTRYDLPGFKYGVKVKCGLRLGKQRGGCWNRRGPSKGGDLLRAVEFARDMASKLGVPVDAVRYRRVRDGHCDWIPVVRGEAIPKGDRYSGELIEEVRYQIRQSFLTKR